MSFMEKYKLTPKKIGKLMLLFVLLMVILWFFFMMFETLLFQVKRMTKIKPASPM